MDTTDPERPAGELAVGLRRLGFFDEFTYEEGPDGSVLDAVRSAPVGDGSRVVTYLESGPLVLAFADTAVDAVDGVSKVPGAGSLATDGTWVWDMQLPYYFRNYNIALPEDFLRWVRSNNYINPWHGVEDLSMNVTW